MPRPMRERHVAKLFQTITLIFRGTKRGGWTRHKTQEIDIDNEVAEIDNSIIYQWYIIYLLTTNLQ